MVTLNPYLLVCKGSNSISLQKVTIKLTVVTLIFSVCTICKPSPLACLGQEGFHHINDEHSSSGSDLWRK